MPRDRDPADRDPVDVSTQSVLLNRYMESAHNALRKRELLEASRLFETSLEKARYVGDTPKELESLKFLSATLLELKNPAEAEPYLRQHYALVAQLFGRYSPKTLESLSYLISALEKQGKIREAYETLQPLVAGTNSRSHDSGSKELQLLATQSQDLSRRLRATSGPAPKQGQSGNTGGFSWRG
jgi:hypothetical protein